MNHLGSPVAVQATINLIFRKTPTEHKGSSGKH